MRNKPKLILFDPSNQDNSLQKERPATVLKRRNIQVIVKQSRAKKVSSKYNSPTVKQIRPAKEFKPIISDLDFK